MGCQPVATNAGAAANAATHFALIGTFIVADPHAELLNVAVAAARDGGQVLMRYFRTELKIRDKSAVGGATYDLVSDADLESEQAVAKRLLQAYPNHQLLGEEELGKGVDVTACEHLWIIDPLDGTNNFAHTLPQFAVSIAYYHFGQPIVGVVYNPATDDLYTASAGSGAWHNGKPAQVCSASSLAQALMGCGFYYDRGEMMRRTLQTIEELFGHHIHGIRRFGAASLDLCMVGCGQLSGFFEYRLSPWDFAAGRLFVEQAGGRVSTAGGDPLGIVPSSVVASNGRLHEPILAITRTHQLELSS